MAWDQALFVKEHQRNMWNKRKMACLSATQRKTAEAEFNGCVFDAVWVEWSLNSCKFQECNNYFLVLKKSLRDTRVNLHACCLFKQNPNTRNFSWYARPLKICEVCNFGAITVSLTCERFVPDRILNWSLVSFNLELLVLQGGANFY